jgi:hypothetical protein
MQSRRGEKLASFIVGSEHCPVRHTPASTRVLTQFYSETRPLVNGFKGNKHKSFRTVDEAEEYLRQDSTSDTEASVADQPRTAEPRGVCLRRHSVRAGNASYCCCASERGRKASGKGDPQAASSEWPT